MEPLLISALADRQVAEAVRALDSWLHSAADDDETRLVVETSGSTGRPKQVVLSRRAVLASVDATTERLRGSGGWVLQVPHTTIAGVQVIVRSLVAGGPPRTDLASLGTHAEFVSLVPTQLQRALADSESTDALARARAVLLGGGPVPRGLRERAADASITTVATYGSAETSGGCVYDGRPLAGVQVRADDEGRLHLASPTLFRGYLDDPELTDRSLVDGWFATSDHGEVAADGSVRVLGRLDDVVVSGGMNIPAGVVAARIREHPRVDAAEALGMPDPEWGNVLVAVVVGDVERDELRDWVAAEHPRAWAPLRVVTTDHIPQLAAGKTDRAAIRALVERAGVGS